MRRYGFPPSREWRGVFCENDGNPWLRGDWSFFVIPAKAGIHWASQWSTLDSFLESTESSIPGSIFQAHLASIQFALNKAIAYWSIRKYRWIISVKFANFWWNMPYYLANFHAKMKQKTAQNTSRRPVQGAFMDSRLRGNDKERSITTQLWVPVILAKCSSPFPKNVPRHSREGGNPLGITVIHAGVLFWINRIFHAWFHFFRRIYITEALSNHSASVD